MPDQLPIVVVTGVPVFSDPFAQDLSPNFVGAGLSLNEAAAALEALYPGATPEPAEASTVAVPLVPEFIPEVLVTGARAVTRAVTSQLTPAGIALSFFTPSPIASQDQENVLLDQMNAWREFLNPTDAGTPALPQSPALPASTVLPQITQLPTVTVSPPQPRTPPRTVFPIVELGPSLMDFSPTELDVPLPQIDIPADAPPAPPDKVAAPSLPGEVPIGLPRPGVITLPRDIPWWEMVPAVATPSMTPEPGPTFVPFLPSIPDVTRTDPITGTNPVTGVQPGLDTPADRVGGGTRVADRVPPIVDFPALLEPSLAVPTPDTLRPAELVPFLEPGVQLTPATGIPLPFDSPFAEPWTATPPRIGDRTTVDECDCAQKKPKKKRKPREKCYRGTYIQRAKGTVFRPTEEVPCDAPLPKKSVSKRETDTFGRPVPKTRKSRKSNKWKDILDEVFNPKP